MASLLGAILVPPYSGANDVVAGERLFRGQCMGCHSLEPGDVRAGPTLHDLFGRTSGTSQGFEFSMAMIEADIVWTSETLDAFLADPAGTVPGTYMVFWGLEEEQRRQIIAYLKEAVSRESASTELASTELASTELASIEARFERPASQELASTDAAR